VSSNYCHVLTSWEADVLLSLFGKLLPRHLVVQAVIEKTASGSVYVNDLRAPTAAAVCADTNWFVAGQASGGFYRGLRCHLPVDTYCVIIADGQADREHLDLLMHGRYFVEAVSRHAERTDPAPVLPPLADGYTTRSIDRFLAPSFLEGVDELIEEITDSWVDLERFFSEGFGTCAVREGRIVSRSFTDYVCGDRCEIGIWTHPDHRRMGIGAHVAAVTANEAFRRGFSAVGWHSWASNAGSIGVSKRAGFVDESYHTVHINHWPAANPENMQPEEYRAFALRYERMFAVAPPEGSGYPHLVAATAWALAGNRDGCLRNLHAAADMGWLRSLEQLIHYWPELLASPGIETRPGWREFFARLDRSAA